MKLKSSVVMEICWSSCKNKGDFLIDTQFVCESRFRVMSKERRKDVGFKDKRLKTDLGALLEIEKLNSFIFS